MARDEKIQVRVSERVKADFDQLAEELGMTSSALGSYVIGNYIVQQRRNEKLQNSMVEPMVEKMSSMVEKEEVSGNHLNKIMELFLESTNSSDQNRP